MISKEIHKKEESKVPNPRTKSSLHVRLQKKITSLRLKNKFTKTGLSEKAGIALRNYLRIEAHETKDINLDTIERLAKAFRISVSKLLDC